MTLFLPLDKYLFFGETKFSMAMLFLLRIFAKTKSIDIMLIVKKSLKNMKRFLVSSLSVPALKRSNSTKSQQGNLSASERANEFDGHFYADGGKLFCKYCNICVDHVQKLAQVLAIEDA